MSIGRLRSLSELVKFTALAALLAMFTDAAVAHAMLWGNDPYWTYWVTDGMLMATVFGVGTAWFGMGLGRGAVLTGIHILLLTAYYWTFSPIGLPAHAEWLDLERTWVTGLPVHFGVYYFGYVVALWLWTRRQRRRPVPAVDAVSLGRVACGALAVSAGVVIVLGLLQTWVSGQFPGVTWFIVRIAVSCPFVLAWWAMAGVDRIAAGFGGVLLGFLLITYGHFLAPMGLPNPSLRLVAIDPPPAFVQWLSYRQEFFVMLPAALVLAIVAMLIASRWHRDEPVQVRAWGRAATAAIVAAAAVLVGLGVVASMYTGPEANRATVSSSGAGQVERGDPFSGELIATTAALTMTVENRNTHRTPLPPHDEVDIKSTVSGEDGTVYTIRATQPMVSDPRGRFTTWSGVGIDVWLHGRSGIGVAALPPMNSSVAVFALGDVNANDKPIAAGVPVHVMTSSRDGARLELVVGDPAFPVFGLQDGHLRVVWPDYTGGHSRSTTYARYAWGGGVLLALLGFAIAVTRREIVDNNW